MMNKRQKAYTKILSEIRKIKKMGTGTEESHRLSNIEKDIVLMLYEEGAILDDTDERSFPSGGGVTEEMEREALNNSAVINKTTVIHTGPGVPVLKVDDNKDTFAEGGNEWLVSQVSQKEELPDNKYPFRAENFKDEESFPSDEDEENEDTEPIEIKGDTEKDDTWETNQNKSSSDSSEKNFSFIDDDEDPVTKDETKELEEDLEEEAEDEFDGEEEDSSDLEEEDDEEGADSAQEDDIMNTQIPPNAPIVQTVSMKDIFVEEKEKSYADFQYQRSVIEIRSEDHAPERAICTIYPFTPTEEDRNAKIFVVVEYGNDFYQGSSYDNDRKVSNMVRLRVGEHEILFQGQFADWKFQARILPIGNSQNEEIRELDVEHNNPPAQRIKNGHIKYRYAEDKDTLGTIEVFLIKDKQNHKRFTCCRRVADFVDYQFVDQVSFTIKTIDGVMVVDAVPKAEAVESSLKSFNLWRERQKALFAPKELKLSDGERSQTFNLLYAIKYILIIFLILGIVYMVIKTGRTGELVRLLDNGIDKVQSKIEKVQNDFSENGKEKQDEEHDKGYLKEENMKGFLNE